MPQPTMPATPSPRDAAGRPGRRVATPRGPRRAKPLDYRAAGVDIDAGNALVERIKPLARATRRAGVLADVGGFGGLFCLDTARYPQATLVAATDGVGTKLKLAFATGRHDTIGIDLVAMCANDIVTQGAEPLFFMDYFATAALSLLQAETVIKGIAAACAHCGCALLGGESAELPGMYRPGEYDLAGFAVGIVNRDKIIDGAAIRRGDSIIGIASDGPHANGYSLIREILQRGRHDLNAPFGDGTLGEVLLQPTRIYVKPLLALMARVSVCGLAHITGGGLVENIPRILPPGVAAKLEPGSWRPPPIFQWLQQQGDIADSEMRRVFNCGIGMCVVVAPTDAEQALAILRQHGERASVIGAVAAGANEVIW